ncbi:MAG: hypothetical protein HOV94_15620 [Saccharothrix sp.]|nr:hypothetical protein [Saccharothrix sp.]
MRALLINPAGDCLAFLTDGTLGPGCPAFPPEADGHEVDIHDPDFDEIQRIPGFHGTREFLFIDDTGAAEAADLDPDAEVRERWWRP